MGVDGEEEDGARVPEAVPEVVPEAVRVLYEEVEGEIEEIEEGEGGDGWDGWDEDEAYEEAYENAFFYDEGGGSAGRGGGRGARGGAGPGSGGGAGAGAGSEAGSQRLQHEAQRFSNKVNLGDLETGSSRTGALERLLQVKQNKEGVVPQGLTKDGRKTQEQVLDPRTRLIIFKMLNNDVLHEIHGCVSTGKEANVYYATGARRAVEELTEAEREAWESASAGLGLEAERRLPDGGGRGALEETYDKQGRLAALVPAMAVRLQPGVEEPALLADLAVKIFKTSILVFKDRDKYVTGDFRFRRGYSKKNPRKMVATWAEKEMRNLTRLWHAGVRCPQPLLLRSHLLIMRFIGDDGVGAPKLKEANLGAAEKQIAYDECVRMTRTMFQDARLVHGDLSEYNTLWYGGHVYFIDVSQAVEWDHPRALDFLRHDLTQLTRFFGSDGDCGVMTVRELFDFVTHPALRTPEQVDAYLDEAMLRVDIRNADVVDGGDGGEERRAQEEVDAAVFEQVFLPQRLDEVDDHERVAERLQSGDTEGIYYAKMLGLGGDLKAMQDPFADPDGAGGKDRMMHAAALRSPGQLGEGVHQGPSSGEGSSENDEESDSGSDLGSHEWIEGESFEARRERIKQERKANKIAVKADRAERRRTKTPKKVKKRKAILSKKGRK